MDLYYKDISPPSRAVYATIKHLKLPVNIKEINLFGGETRSEEYRKINPAHQVPFLNDNGFLLSESRAILTYLVNQYSPNHALYPSEPRARAQIDRMLYHEGINLFPLAKQFFIKRVRRQQDLSEEDIITVRTAIDELIALKGDNRFMTGSQASLADISVAMSYAHIRSFLPEEVARLNDWYKAVEEAVPEVKEINDKVDFSVATNAIKQR